jgi:hypothetical protein
MNRSGGAHSSFSSFMRSRRTAISENDGRSITLSCRHSDTSWRSTSGSGSVLGRRPCEPMRSTNCAGCRSSISEYGGLPVNSSTSTTPNENMSAGWPYLECVKTSGALTGRCCPHVLSMLQMPCKCTRTLIDIHVQWRANDCHGNGLLRLNSGSSEIRHFTNPSITDQQVLWLQIAMNHCIHISFSVSTRLLLLLLLLLVVVVAVVVCSMRLVLTNTFSFV